MPRQSVPTWGRSLAPARGRSLAPARTTARGTARSTSRQTAAILRLPALPKALPKALRAPTTNGGLRVPSLLPRPKTRLIVVYGYTCDVFANTTAARKNSLKAIAARHRHATGIQAVDVFCNTETAHTMTRDILLRLLRQKKPLPDSAFVEKVRKAVCDALRRGERVLLVGHSYGGSVATRIAEKVPCAHADRLEVATFGSIYIRSPRALTPGVTAKHYSYDVDIAAMCHGRNVKTCTFVNVLPTTLKSGLQAHMNYQKHINRVAHTGSIYM